jgi:purine-binding chemotaxis protein CheW
MIDKSLPISTATANSNNPPPPGGLVADQQGPGQYLTFSLATETLAIGILAIKEIIGYQNVTTVPTMPDYVMGVINLRGAVVPVLDLQARFGRKSSELTKRTCIVILEVNDEEQENHVIGIMVDAVNEVLDIAATDIEPPPSFGSRIAVDFIQGMGKVGNDFVVLLNVDRVFSLEDLTRDAKAA